jgi:putrescine aminotransferase
MAHPAAMKRQAPDIMARGEGCWVWDVDGHKLLDGVGGLWSSNLGPQQPPVRDAIVAQLDELPFYNVFRGTTHVRAIELSARLVQTDGARRAWVRSCSPAAAPTPSKAR